MISCRAPGHTRKMNYKVAYTYAGRMASDTPEYEESWRESCPSRFRDLDVEVGSLVCQRTTSPISQRRAGFSGGLRVLTRPTTSGATWSREASNRSSGGEARHAVQKAGNQPLGSGSCLPDGLVDHRNRLTGSSIPESRPVLAGRSAKAAA